MEIWLSCNGQSFLFPLIPGGVEFGLQEVRSVSIYLSIFCLLVLH